MFKNLYKIDWKNLEAEDVPQIIEQLFSQDKRLRSNAFDLFDERVVYNGNMKYWQEINLGHYISKILVSDLQLVTVPFLYEIIVHPQHSNKEVYDFLIAFALYATMHDEGEIYRQRAIQIKEEIWKNIDDYIIDLSNPEPIVRRSVFSLLCKYTDKVGVVVPILLKHLRLETDTLVKSRMFVLFENAFVLPQILNNDDMKAFQALKSSINSN
jgi:hypothetical protein